MADHDSNSTPLAAVAGSPAYEHYAALNQRLSEIEAALSGLVRELAEDTAPPASRVAQLEAVLNLVYEARRAYGRLDDLGVADVCRRIEAALAPPEGLRPP